MKWVFYYLILGSQITIIVEYVFLTSMLTLIEFSCLNRSLFLEHPVYFSQPCQKIVTRSVTNYWRNRLSMHDFRSKFLFFASSVISQVDGTALAIYIRVYKYRSTCSRKNGDVRIKYRTFCPPLREANNEIWSFKSRTRKMTL